jgi:hypothetical protein
MRLEVISMGAEPTILPAGWAQAPGGLPHRGLQLQSPALNGKNQAATGHFHPSANHANRMFAGNLTTFLAVLQLFGKQGIFPPCLDDDIAAGRHLPGSRRPGTLVRGQHHLFFALAVKKNHVHILDVTGLARGIEFRGVGLQ